MSLPGEGRRVLIVRTGAMGDVLHALPAVAALRQTWPRATIDWTIDPRWAPLLVDADGRGPVVSGIPLANTRSWSHAPLSRKTLHSILALRQALRNGRYTDVIDVQGTLRSAFIAGFGAGRHAAGFADPREGAARWLYGRHLQRRGVHVAEQTAALLGDALGVLLEPVAPPLPMCPKPEAWASETAAAIARPIALLAPTAGWGAKQWPAVHFGKLAVALHAMNFEVMVNAASYSEPAAAEVVASAAGAATIVVCNVADLVALTRRAAVVVGGDTGPVHLAAALGVPVVALYGPTDPARNGPWGPGAKRVLRDAVSITSYKRSMGTEAGLARMEVGDVVHAVRAVLGGA